MVLPRESAQSRNQTEFARFFFTATIGNGIFGRLQQDLRNSHAKLVSQRKQVVLYLLKLTVPVCISEQTLIVIGTIPTDLFCSWMLGEATDWTSELIDL